MTEERKGPVYADKATLLRALTQLHEEVLDEPLTRHFFGGAVLIREIDAQQRQNANDAAVAQDEERPDQSLYRAMLIQQSVVDPMSGQPYPDGRPGEDGLPLINPKTRTPLFTVGEILSIVSGRDVQTRELADRIMRLSALGPAPLFRGDQTADGGKRDEGKGDEVGGDIAEGNPSPRTGDPDGGSTLSGALIQGDGGSPDGDA